VSGFRSWTLVDGAFREGAAAVPVTDRGFRYGMSVFETLAVRKGRILFLRQHLEALEIACAEAGFQAHNTEALSALEGLEDGLLRIYVTAGDGSSVAPSGECRTFGFFEPAEFPRPEDVLRGARVAILRAPRVSVLGGWKTGNYWPNVQAFAAARDNGFDEVLVLDSRGAVVSASMANVFFVFGAVLRTPAVYVGARRGVVRAWIKEMTHVDESFLTLEDIKEADECFVTNSRLGVMPVAEIEGRCLPSRNRGGALAALYRERILGE
jgi:branched-subunit amino acid aminotransferase/4-amino-4-deoxychorismate lyase